MGADDESAPFSCRCGIRAGLFADDVHTVNDLRFFYHDDFERQILSDLGNLIVSIVQASIPIIIYIYVLRTSGLQGSFGRIYTSRAPKS